MRIRRVCARQPNATCVRPPASADRHHPDTPPAHAGTTTAVGEKLPGPEGRVVSYQRPLPQSRGAALFNLVTYPLAVGLGFGLIAGLLRLVF